MFIAGSFLFAPQVGAAARRRALQSSAAGACLSPSTARGRPLRQLIGGHLCPGNPVVRPAKRVDARVFTRARRSQSVGRTRV